MQNNRSIIISAIIWLTLLCIPACGDPSPVSKLKAEARAGDAPAQFYLGQMYEVGKQVTKDQAEAVRWYREAAKQDHPGAQSRLGLLYDLGKGVTKDANEAARWLRKAAEQGDYIAQLWLSVMYSRGRGVTKDDAEANKWGHKAFSNTSGSSSWLLVPDEGMQKIIKEQLHHIIMEIGNQSAIDAVLEVKRASGAEESKRRSAGEK